MSRKDINRTRRKLRIKQIKGTMSSSLCTSIMEGTAIHVYKQRYVLTHQHVIHTDDNKQVYDSNSKRLNISSSQSKFTLAFLS